MTQKSKENWTVTVILSAAYAETATISEDTVISWKVNFYIAGTSVQTRKRSNISGVMMWRW